MRKMWVTMYEWPSGSGEPNCQEVKVFSLQDEAERYFRLIRDAATSKNNPIAKGCMFPLFIDAMTSSEERRMFARDYVDTNEFPHFGSLT